jgi:hypothetical protein
MLSAHRIASLPSDARILADGETIEWSTPASTLKFTATLR